MLHWIEGSSLGFAVELRSATSLQDTDVVIQVSHDLFPVPIVVDVVFTLIAVLSPVAGLLTDIKFSRYRAVVYSSCIITIQSTVFIVLVLLACAGQNFLDTKYKRYVTAVCGAVIFATVYIIFIINGFQFGMDQLHDSPTEDFILFIHWYVWIYYTCLLVAEIVWNLIFHDSYHIDFQNSLEISGCCVLGFICVTVLSLNAFSLCVLRHRKLLFLLEPAGVNPYKLVYTVTKFVCQHKVPLRRSAFTYCTEELPSRMDVGKQKYGGPFTTKQVEDVKAFWGIVKLVLSFGPAFFLRTVTQSFLPAFAKHGNVFLLNTTDGNSTFHREVHLEGMARYILISNGLLSSLLVVICIPLYLCWIRPRIRYHIPGMLKRMGLAIIVMVLSLICIVAMDILVHLKNTESAGCMFLGFPKYTVNALPLYQNVYFLASQHVLSAVTNMLLDIAVLEFICSQSPYSMKGLLLGILFSVKSLSQGIAITSMIPFGALWKIHSLSCGSGFYLMNIIIGLLALAVFVCVAKRYKYREINEPSNEYRYAEEYYSNIQ